MGAADSLYDTDFYAWTCEQKSLLGSKKFDRLDIEHLSENSSLRANLEEQIVLAYDVAIYEAAKETGFDEHFFSSECEWSVDQLLNIDFLP